MLVFLTDPIQSVADFARTKWGSLFSVSLGVLALATSSPLQANELDLSVQVGHDSNPFRLSEGFDPEGGEYLETSIKGQFAFSDAFFLSARLKDRRYGADEEDADNMRGSLGIGLKQKLSFFEKKSRLKTVLSAGLRDKTYVSRLTGDIAESGGESIADRYDYHFYDWTSELDIKWDKQNRFQLYVDVQQRDYESFESLGLSNYDYLDVAIGSGWKHKLAKGSSIRASLEKNFRKFDDRRELDLEGNALAGTDLSYDGWQVKLAYSKRFNANWRMALNGQYDIRQDSGSGYYDWNRVSMRASLSYHPFENSTYKASVAYHEDTYDKRAENASLDDEELSEEQGYRFRLAYERAFSSVEGLQFVVQYRYDDFEGDVAEYRYDRHQVSLGLKQAF